MTFHGSTLYIALQRGRSRFPIRLFQSLIDPMEAQGWHEELETALKMAAQMRDHDVDPFFIAKSLLSHNYRISCLEEVMQAADRYINMGMAEAERTRLIRAIEKAKDIDSYTSQTERNSFGLE